MALTPSFVQKVEAIETRLGMPQGSLLSVMRFETGGTFDPAVKNKAGSGATGLIQFMPSTAKSLGTSTDALAKMSAEDQLEYVEKYFQPYKGKLGTLQDVYMGVLYPKAIGKPESYPLFRQDQQPTAYSQNAGLDRDKKGMVTVGDAVAAVQRGGAGGPPAPGVVPWGGAVPTRTAERPATPVRDWWQQARAEEVAPLRVEPEEGASLAGEQPPPAPTPREQAPDLLSGWRLPEETAPRQPAQDWASLFEGEDRRVEGDRRPRQDWSQLFG